MKYIQTAKYNYPEEIFVTQSFFRHEWTNKHLVLKQYNEYVLSVFLINGEEPSHPMAITNNFIHEANFLEMSLERYLKIKSFL